MTDRDAAAILDAKIVAEFEALYHDLSKIGFGLLGWRQYMAPGRWWHFHYNRWHREVASVFARHGHLLTRHNVEHYFTICRVNPQRFDEDAGTAIVRQLRAAFGYRYIDQWIGGEV